MFYCNLPHVLARLVTIRPWFNGRNPPTNSVEPFFRRLFPSCRNRLTAVSFVIGQQVSVEFRRQLITRARLCSFWLACFHFSPSVFRIASNSASLAVLASRVSLIVLSSNTLGVSAAMPISYVLHGSATPLRQKRKPAFRNIGSKPRSRNLSNAASHCRPVKN